MARCGVVVVVPVPSLRIPVVIVTVVPFIVGLSAVRLGLGVVVRLIDIEGLVSSPVIPFGILVVIVVILVVTVVLLRVLLI